jgi:septum formation protein
MRKIILASKSKARQRLLRQVGLPFQVAQARVKEGKVLRGRCSDLVIKNALSKARDVAARFDSGIVIGADTVVLVGKKIVGKPKNLNDAFRALKALSKGPQWVYTGIAVIDIDKAKTYTAYEKTKVYMLPLTDRQIRKYFKKISPFDKAGSFDVQGPGSIFIDRIEGCFYNVVGLPLAKLARILKKIGIEVF